MRQTALNSVFELAKIDPRILFIGSDLGHGTLERMKTELPNQFFMEGIAEQHIIGFAAGLAKQGFIPFVNTIATFFTRRAYEQIAIDLALHKSHVVLLASGGGMVYAPLGPTHTAIEDIALMSAIPGMKIACPADPLEMNEVILSSIKEPGPWYIRMGKGGEPTVVDKYSTKFGNVKLFGGGAEKVLLVTTGILLHTSLELKSSDEELGSRFAILHIPILDELESESVIRKVREADTVVILEEHIPVGGIFTQMLHLAHKFGIDTRKLVQISLPHVFPHNYGSQREHLAHHKLDKFGISEILMKIIDSIEYNWKK